MKRSIVGVAVLALSLSGFAALAQEPGAQPEQDMSKMGPWARKPKNEKKVKQELTRFFKEEEALMKKGDFDAMLARIDFPVFMVTDTLDGKPMTKAYTRAEYDQMMRPMMEGMEEMKTTHKPTYTVLSDSLVVVSDNFTTTMGKKKLRGKSASLLVKKDGKWMWKMMAEAGWGSMPAVGGAGEQGQQMKQKK